MNNAIGSSCLTQKPPAKCYLATHGLKFAVLDMWSLFKGNGEGSDEHCACWNYGCSDLLKMIATNCLHKAGVSVSKTTTNLALITTSCAVPPPNPTASRQISPHHCRSHLRRRCRTSAPPLVNRSATPQRWKQTPTLIPLICPMA